jgi:lipid-A-disaccharide synthase-like uncharacterized protein
LGNDVFGIDSVWLVIGFLGQGLFFARFLVQWIASERQRQSVIPTAFWFFSIGGGLVLLSYAVHRRDPVFIAGQGMGLLIYSRNLWFIFRHRAAAEPGAAPPGDPR